MLAVVALAGACRRVPDATFAQANEARQRAADLRVELAKAVGASDRAVMADTDEASIAFAREADRAKAAVQADAAALAPLLQSLEYRNEAKYLSDFQAHFEEYSKVDRGVLALAVENTNLKAQRLSFGPVRQAADALSVALKASIKTVATKDRCRAEGLVADTLLAVREIQVLQAPHIAEPDDATMSRLEKQMTELEASARRALATLTGIVGGGGQLEMTQARGALDNFSAMSRQLVALSRRNTNVRSLEMSLHQKPALAAACDASLSSLTDALAKEGSSATK